MTKAAKHDSQHFVPQFYLKGWCPFASESSDTMKCIRAWNVRAGRIQGLASIKGECSRRGFYGPTGNQTDTWLTRIENGISDYIWRFRNAPPRMPSAEEDAAIRMFMSIQMPRTRYIEEEMHELMSKVPELFEDEQDKVDIAALLMPPNTDMSDQIPLIAKDALIATSDLDLLVVVNDTDSELVTSDNPVVMINNGFPRHLHMGLYDSGLLVVLPLSPERGVVLYDRATYGRKKVVKCTPNDVHVLNLFQACNARNNLYFRDAHTNLANVLAKARRHRVESTPYVARALADNPEDGEILHFANRRPNPRVGLSFCQPSARFRRKFGKQRASSSTVVQVPERATSVRRNAGPASGMPYADSMADGTRLTETARAEIGTVSENPKRKAYKA